MKGPGKSPMRHKKVYQLKKAGSQKPANEVECQGEQTQNYPKNQLKSQFQSNSPKTPRYHSPNPKVNSPQLSINTLSLAFNAALNNVDVRNLTIKNIGNSTIYFEWKSRNLSKINSNAVKDTKPKFYCHYDNYVIKPAEEVIFSFSFLSEIPGYFIEQWQLICRPPITTKIANIKMEGKAYIGDKLEEGRVKFNTMLNNEMVNLEVRETVEDIISDIKTPIPPRPNVQIPSIAEYQFETKNDLRRLYYLPLVHQWFNQLHQQLAQHLHLQDVFWDQSVDTLFEMLSNCQHLDQVSKLCYKQRIEHYCHLSTFPSPNKSLLYSNIKQFLNNTAYKLGGEIVDSVRKELDMWEVPFRQPLEDDNEVTTKNREQEISKIKAEWVKKSKKKKWTEEDERDLIKQYKNKLEHKVNKQMLDCFEGFDQKAQFIKAQIQIQKINKTQNQNKTKNQKFNENQFHNLQRIKTVKQIQLENKKILIKFHLKIKNHSQSKLNQLAEYLLKKQQEEKKIEEQKKNQQGNKKKKNPVSVNNKKKKNQKEEQQIKPITFDFNSLFDQQNWQGFKETYKTIMQKQPLLVLIGVTYGPRLGKFIKKYSIQFLLQYLKSIDQGIQFISFQNLHTLKKKVEEQTVAQGSVYLLQNLNFLPCQAMKEQSLIMEGEIQKTVTRKLLYPQISFSLNQYFGTLVDYIVNEDRYGLEASGILSYLHKQSILGSLWWKYIGLTLKAYNKNNSKILIGGQLSGEKLILLFKALNVFQKVYLVGQLGVKIAIAMLQLFKEAKDQIKHCGIIIKSYQNIAIKNFIKICQQNSIIKKLEIPNDFVTVKPTHQNNGGEVNQNVSVYEPGVSIIQNQIQNIIDIGPKTLSKILSSIDKGYLCVLGQPNYKKNNYTIANYVVNNNSLAVLMKGLYKKQQDKRQRHKIQQTQASGINYNEDIVIILIGIHKSDIQLIQLKQSKKKINIEEKSEEIMNQPNQQELIQQEENEISKIDLVADFKLSSIESFENILLGKTNNQLKNISMYPKSND